MPQNQRMIQRKNAQLVRKFFETHIEKSITSR